jgi:hypothetical protein
MKSHQWFKYKLNKLKNDPEFLRDYIKLLESIIDELAKPKQCSQCGLIQPKFINCGACGFPIGI